MPGLRWRAAGAACTTAVTRSGETVRGPTNGRPVETGAVTDSGGLNITQGFRPVTVARINYCTQANPPRNRLSNISPGDTDQSADPGFRSLRSLHPGLFTVAPWGSQSRSQPFVGRAATDTAAAGTAGPTRSPAATRSRITVVTVSSTRDRIDRPAPHAPTRTGMTAPSTGCSATRCWWSRPG